MKRLLGISLLALVVAAVSAPRASAWANFNFGVGLNLSYQTANNCWLWGAIRNGPVGVENSNWAYGPAPGLGGQCATPYYNAAFAYPAPVGGAPPVVTAPAPWIAPAPTPSIKERKDSGASGAQRSSYFQPVAYPYGNGYPQTGNYAPAYNYSNSYYPYNAGYSQAPSYWWSR